MSATADTPRQAPQSWLDALERARADVAAGRTFEMKDVLKELRANLAEMEASEPDVVFS